MEPLTRLKNKINVISGLRLFADGKPFNPHLSGAVAVMTGNVPAAVAAPYLPSIDNIIAEKIGVGTRFRSIEMTATGNARDSYSYRGGRVANSAEVSPLALYTRLFGPEFVDPNVADFTPDPAVLIRRSALSGVTEQRQELFRRIGASDRQRLDEYFTSVRQLEQQLEIQSQKPAPLQSCVVPRETKESSTGQEITQVKANHVLFARLSAHALACNQTHVFNMVFTNAISGLRKDGESSTHHILTHEESIDQQLGYQKRATWYLGEIITAFGDFLKEFESVREGDRTLLDRTVVYATSEGGLAKLHAAENIPILTAGSGNGRLKTGIHVPRKGDSVARVGLTLQQAFGIPAAKWGTDSCETSKPITEIMA